MIDDLERELTRAMAADVADLPPPQLDLRRIQRRPVRRYALPGAVVAVAVAAAAPIAAAGTGVLDRSPVSADNDVVPVSIPVTTPAGLPKPPPVESIDPPAPPTGATGRPEPTCVARHHTFSSGERAAAVQQLRAAAVRLAHQALGEGAGRRVLTLSPAELDRLLPQVGATVTYQDCWSGHDPTAAERAAAIAEVRRAGTDLQTAALGARSALERALGDKQLPSWLGDLEVTVVSRTADRLVIRIVFGQPKRGWPLSGSITVVIRLPDRMVVAVDMSRLALPPGLSVPRHPLPLPSVPLPVPSPPEVPGLPTGGR